MNCFSLIDNNSINPFCFFTLHHFTFLHCLKFYTIHSTEFSGMIYSFNIKFIGSKISNIKTRSCKLFIFGEKGFCCALLNHPIQWFVTILNLPMKTFRGSLSLEKSLKTALACFSTALGPFSGLPDLFWTSSNCLGHLSRRYIFVDILPQNCKLHLTKMTYTLSLFFGLQVDTVSLFSQGRIINSFRRYMTRCSQYVIWIWNL